MKKILYYIFLLSISLYVYNCGIPSGLTSIDPPDVLSLSSVQEVGFNQPDSTQGLVGYEIYYKIYKYGSESDDEISNDFDKFDKDHDDYEFKSGSGIPDALKFKRLLRLADPLTDTALTSTSFPLVLQADIDGIDFILHMDYDDYKIYYDSDLKAVPIRNVKDIDGNYKDFGDLIESSDLDSNGVEEDDSYTIAFAAYSYTNGVGLNMEYQNSRPVYLGKIVNLTNVDLNNNE